MPLLTVERYLYRSGVSLEGVGLDMPEVPDHPNRLPFTAVLSRIEEASTRPPNGSEGHKVWLTRAAVEQALPSLIGMGVDCTDDMTGHAKRTKIGVITEATIGGADGKDLIISGHLFEKDFGSEVDYIRQHKSRMGASYEISNVSVEDTSAPIWKIDSMVFTGAALLFKDKAAYAKTSVYASIEAAAADVEALRESVYLLHLQSLSAQVARLRLKPRPRKGSHG
jgi:hypothetical protein